MTNRQKQMILCHFGELGTEDIDNLWGEQSAEATERLQRRMGIEADGIFGEQTTDRALQVIMTGETLPELKADATDTDVGSKEDWWSEIRWFTRNESGIACPCGRCGGFPVEPVERLMRNADAVREHFGRPAIPSSTVRCAAHNAELPGSAANSLHMRGKAMDFCIQGVNSSVTLAYVKTLPGVDEAYAIDESYVHMGVNKY